jgi:pSer/pThr/pTyr-binding forkhead associated (FHA) protein
VLRRDEGIFIEDLGSINGSFINGQKLLPYQIEPLADGDIIRLGRLDVEVSLF